MDAQGQELTAADLWRIFEREYRLDAAQAPRDRSSRRCTKLRRRRAAAAGRRARSAARRWRSQGEGNGPVDAFVDGLARAAGVPMRVLDYHEHAIGGGAQARAVAYLELRIGDSRTLFGVGIDANIVTASMKAVLSRACSAPASRLQRRPPPLA